MCEATWKWNHIIFHFVLTHDHAFLMVILIMLFQLLETTDYIRLVRFSTSIGLLYYYKKFGVLIANLSLVLYIYNQIMDVF